MSKRQELLQQIAHLESSKQLLEQQLAELSEKVKKIKVLEQQLSELRAEVQQFESIEDSKKLLERLLAAKLAEVQQIDDKLQEQWDNCAFLKDTTTKKLAEYFKGLGYLIVECQTKTQENHSYAIAKQVWNCKEISIAFLKELYKAGKEALIYPTADLTPQNKASLINLCKTMADKGWISYTKTKSYVEVKSTLPKGLKNFPNGGWAEEVNRYLINKVLAAYATQHKQLKYKVFWDIKLRAIDSTQPRNGNDMQLDIVVQLNDRFYVFETKTGALGIEKWIQRAEIFNQNGNRFLTCSLASDVDPKLFQPYRLLALDKLEEQLVELLDKDCQAK